MLCATRLRTENPPPNRLPPIHPRQRGQGRPSGRVAGSLGAPTSSSAHGSVPPAGDRVDRVAGWPGAWARRRPRRHTVQSRPRRTGDGAPTTRCVRWVHSRQDRCAASQSLQFGFLCPAKKRPDQKLNQAPRMPVRVLVSPAGGGGHAPRVAGGGLCGPRGRAAVLWMDKSRHTRLPLLRPPCARQTSAPGFPPSTSGKIRTICSSVYRFPFM